MSPTDTDPESGDCMDCGSELIESDRHGWLCLGCSPDSVLDEAMARD